MREFLMRAFETAGRGAQRRVSRDLEVPVTTVNNWAKGHATPPHARWAELEVSLRLASGSIAQAAGVMQPVDHADEIEQLRTELQRQGGEIARLADQVSALADRLLPTETRAGGRSRTLASKDRGGRQP